MGQIELRTFTENEYHVFFRSYVSDAMMDDKPFRYCYEQVSRSYAYNHGRYQEGYAHYGIFLNQQPVGSFQLKRMNEQKKSCEFGIILQNDAVKNKGIGTESIRQGMVIARDVFGMKVIIGDTMGRNKRMIHVFQKLGFELVETVKNGYVFSDGRHEDRLVFQKNLMEA